MLCPKCQRTFPKGTYCPFDGEALVEGGEDADDRTVASPRVRVPIQQGGSMNNIPYESTAATKLDAEPPDPDELQGAVLADRYRLDAKIGKGAMGTVYKGRLLTLDTEVAVKILRIQDSEDTHRLADRFRREAKLIAKIRHPNTVQFIDYGETKDGLPYLVTELLDGRGLEEVLEAGPLPEARAIRIIKQVAGALTDAHAIGVVHRDIKPANIFVTKQEGGGEHVKVLDFGIAKVVHGSGDSRTLSGNLTAAGLAIGTPIYMSPEQAMGKPVVAQSDVYSLGVVAYHCIAGKPPFMGSPFQILDQHQRAEPPPFSTLSPAPKVSAPLEGLIRQMLEKEPEKRPASPRQVFEALERLEFQHTAASTSGLDFSGSMSQKIPRKKKPSVWLWAYVAAGILFLASAVVLATRLMGNDSVQVAPLPEQPSGQTK